ncbi:hypothetical protein BLL40_15195 [Domibacillus mangrovi]|uniref:Uncharacterized protein n=1 Tax=Domibacillus mangrovi TaxID=1714354 RepID=A0A1Q5NZQ0_9BACI|nr:hypothetical protein BLL40_15195 [Domibacillus mangrovi]
MFLLDKEYNTIKLFHERSYNLLSEEFVLINLSSKQTLFLYSFIKVNSIISIKLYFKATSAFISSTF